MASSWRRACRPQLETVVVVPCGDEPAITSFQFLFSYDAAQHFVLVDGDGGFKHLAYEHAGETISDLDRNFQGLAEVGSQLDFNSKRILHEDVLLLEAREAMLLFNHLLEQVRCDCEVIFVAPLIFLVKSSH